MNLFDLFKRRRELMLTAGLPRPPQLERDHDYQQANPGRPRRTRSFRRCLTRKWTEPLIARKLKRTVSAIAKRRSILNKRRLVDLGLKVKTK
jgi:hypothetical protein